MQAGSLRLKEEDSNNSNDKIIDKIEMLEKKIEMLEEKIEKLTSNEPESNEQESCLKNSDKLSIVIENYKKSIIVKNKYTDKFTTFPLKKKFKEIGGKWVNNDKISGWLFLGKYDDKTTLEKSAEFIIKEFESFKKDKFEYEIRFEQTPV